MATRKVAVTIDQQLLTEVDGWVAAGEFSNRSQAVRAALLFLQERRFGRGRLLNELAKLDPREERALAEETLVADDEWPEH